MKKGKSNSSFYFINKKKNLLKSKLSNSRLHFNTNRSLLKYKRSQANIIVVILLILIILVAIVILWRVVLILVESSKSAEELGVFTVNPKIVETQTSFVPDASGCIYVTVNRESGKGNLKGMLFIFANGTNTYNVKEYFDVPLGELETREIEFCQADLGLDITTITGVRTYPILGTAEGKERYGNNVDEIGTGFDGSNLGGGTTGCTNGDTRPCSGSNECKTYTQLCSDGVWETTCTTISGNKADGDTCTGGTCDGNGNCVPTATCTNPCTDNNACTNNDICVSETCSGTAISCDDSNACTTNSCNPSSGCVYSPIASCTNGDGCCPSGCTIANDNDCTIAPPTDYTHYWNFDSYTGSADFADQKSASIKMHVYSMGSSATLLTSCILSTPCVSFDRPGYTNGYGYSDSISGGLQGSPKTLSFWFNPGSLVAATYPEKIIGVLNSYPMRIEIKNNVLWMRGGNSRTDADSISASISDRTNTWNHVAIIWTGNIAKLYLNGVYKGEKSFAGFSGSYLNYEIGSYDEYDSVQAVTGSIDDLKQYDRMLSVAEINALYQTGLP